MLLNKYIKHIIYIFIFVVIGGLNLIQSLNIIMGILNQEALVQLSKID